MIDKDGSCYAGKLADARDATIERPRAVVRGSEAKRRCDEVRERWPTIYKYSHVRYNRLAKQDKKDANGKAWKIFCFSFSYYRSYGREIAHRRSLIVWGIRRIVPLSFSARRTTSFLCGFL